MALGFEIRIEVQILFGPIEEFERDLWILLSSFKDLEEDRRGEFGGEMESL